MPRRYWVAFVADEDALKHGFHLRFGFHCLLADAGFDVCPYEFIGVELRRVGRQEEQFDALVICFDKALNQLGPVGWMAIDNQENLLLHASDQTLKELLELTLLVPKSARNGIGMANLLRSPCSIKPALFLEAGLNEGAAGFARRGLWELYFYVLPNVVAWRGGERRLVVLRRDE